MVPAEGQMVDSVIQKRALGIWAQRAVLSGPADPQTLGGSSGDTGNVLGQCCAIRRAAATPRGRGAHLIESQDTGAAHLERVVLARTSYALFRSRKNTHFLVAKFTL